MQANALLVHLSDMLNDLFYSDFSISNDCLIENSEYMVVEDLQKADHLIFISMKK